MQEYLKKITLPQPGGSPQELRVLTPAEVETRLNERTLTPAQVDAKIDAKLASLTTKVNSLVTSVDTLKAQFNELNKYVADIDAYIMEDWLVSTCYGNVPEDEMANVAKGTVTLAEMKKTLAWADLSRELASADPIDTKALSKAMPRVLPHFDFTGKTQAEINAFFCNFKVGRRSAKYIAGLSGTVSPDISLRYLFNASPGTLYPYDALSFIHLGKVDVDLSGCAASSLFGNSDAQTTGLYDITLRNFNGYGLFMKSPDLVTVKNVAIYVDNRTDASVSEMFEACTKLRTVDIDISGAAEASYMFYGCKSLENVSLGKDFLPKDLGVWLPNCEREVTFGRINCSVLWRGISGGTGLLIHGLIYERFGESKRCLAASFSGYASWDIECVEETLRTLYDRIGAGFQDTVTIYFNANLESSIPAELIAEATAKGFTIIFK